MTFVYEIDVITGTDPGGRMEYVVVESIRAPWPSGQGGHMTFTVSFNGYLMPWERWMREGGYTDEQVEAARGAVERGRENAR